MVGFDKMNFRNVFWKSRIIVFGGHAIAEPHLSFGNEESSILQFIFVEYIWRYIERYIKLNF